MAIALSYRYCGSCMIGWLGLCWGLLVPPANACPSLLLLLLLYVL
mgnify:FL=1